MTHGVSYLCTTDHCLLGWLRITLRVSALKLMKMHLKDCSSMVSSLARQGKGRHERRCILWRTAALQSGDEMAVSDDT